MKQVRKFNQAAAKLGFTLIELSIVLVIIGLIVGGILVGQDLIKAAEIRATVSQMEKYATAVNTFRSKYNGMPGDLLNATNFGFESRSITGTGDGDAQLESAAGTSGDFAGETSCFWDDLNTAGMIADSLNGSTTCGNAQTAASLGSALPIAKLGRGNYLVVGSSAGINYWALTGVTAITAGVYSFDDLLTGLESFQIDSKIDDGAPTSGGVIAMVAQTASAGSSIWTVTDAVAAANTGVCVLAGNLYNFTTASGNDQGCQLRLRSNF